MKYILKTICCLAALVFAAASCQKMTSDGSAETETVRISLVSPTPVTKAIGDGTKAKIVYYTAFVNGSSVPSLCQTVELDANGQAVLDLKLVKNVTYSFVFWAQTPEAAGQPAYYDLSTFYTDANVKVNYDVNANDDLRDAFCAVEEITVTGEIDRDVILRRPFGQINFCASDYEMIKELELQNGMTSEMTVSDVADIINVLDGSVSNSGATVPFNAIFTPAAIPTGDDEYITVQGTEYGYVGMNYVLASENGDNVSVTGKFVNGTSTWETDIIPNVPIKRNYKTNIVGELFVEHGTIKIIVEPSFNDPDEVVGI